MASSGNFATWNGVEIPSYLSLSQGNTKVLGNTSTDASGINLNIGVTSGKWYVEFYVIITTSSYPYVGLSAGETSQDFAASNQGYNGDIRYHTPNSTGMNNNTGSAGISNQWGTITLTETGVDACSNGDVVGFALDMDNKKLFISRNGTFFNSGDPANGTNPQATWTVNPQNAYINCFSYTSSRGCIVNCGQDSTFSGEISAGGNADGNGFGDFKYSPPTGFLALCTANLPISDDIDPAQTDDDFPQKQFNTILYTGIGGTSANNVTGVGFQPDLIWIKNREQSAAFSNCLVDSSRGRSKVLYSCRTDAEATSSTNRDISSINSDGFTIQDTSNIDGNQSGIGYVAWCWKAAAGSTATNSDGDADTTVQANTKAGFSIVQFPNYSGDTKFGHGLTKTPNFIIAKLTASGSNYPTYHDGYSSGKCCFLNLSNAEANSTHFAHSGTGNPVSATTFGMGASFAGSGAGIAYCWHDVEGFQKFGSYIGNGNADGPFIYTGFRPRMIFVKRIDSTASWYVWDTARSTFNKIDDYIEWDTTNAEETGYANQAYDFLSNGFKARGNNNIGNSSGGTYIYGAWGDVSFKYNNTF